MVMIMDIKKIFLCNSDGDTHGLRTPNEGINQRCLKNWADVADKICFSRTIKFAIGIEFAAVETPIKMESRSSIVPY